MGLGCRRFFRRESRQLNRPRGSPYPPGVPTNDTASGVAPAEWSKVVELWRIRGSSSARARWRGTRNLLRLKHFGAEAAMKVIVAPSSESGYLTLVALSRGFGLWMRANPVPGINDSAVDGAAPGAVRVFGTPLKPPVHMLS